MKPDAPREPLSDTMSDTACPAERAEQIFRESPYVALQRLKCRFQDGVLLIAGRVPSYYLKQVALSAVKDLDGVRSVDNLVEVSV